MNQRKFTPATIVTLSRFFLIPVFMYYFVTEQYTYAIIALSIAGFTDALDGFLARRFNMRTRLGSILDPAADKFLMFVSFLTLSTMHVIPWWATGIVVGRDFLMTAGVIILNACKVKLYYRPTYTSKAATASQILLLVTSFFLVYAKNKGVVLYFNEQEIGYAQRMSIYLASLLTGITWLQYSLIGYRFARYGERKK